VGEAAIIAEFAATSITEDVADLHIASA
jgi:hypothetical protein